MYREIAGALSRSHVGRCGVRTGRLQIALSWSVPAGDGENADGDRAVGRRGGRRVRNGNFRALRSSRGALLTSVARGAGNLGGGATARTERRRRSPSAARARSANYFLDRAGRGAHGPQRPSRRRGGLPWDATPETKSPRRSSVAVTVRAGAVGGQAGSSNSMNPGPIELRVDSPVSRSTGRF